MAGQRLTDKTAFTDNLASDDLLMCVDTSDTTGSAAGTSKKIDNKFIIQTDKVSVTSVIFLAMDSSGGAGTYATLIAAPDAGYFIQILGITAVVDYISGTQGSKVALYFGWDATSPSPSYASASGFMHNQTADLNYAFSANNTPSAAGGVGGIDNRGVVVFSGGNFSSTFNADFYITYQIVKT